MYRTPDKSHTEQQTAYGKYLTETLLLMNDFDLVVFTSYRNRFALAVNCEINSTKTIHVPASFGNVHTLRYDLHELLISSRYKTFNDPDNYPKKCDDPENGQKIP